MTQLGNYTAYIEDQLKKIDFPAQPNELYDPLRYILELGGKRIRPILTLLGAELFGSSKESCVNQAIAIEVLHNFTLIHDDIMDEAPLRRGKQTIHAKWNQNIAILSGDAMLIKAYQLCSKVDIKNLSQILELFNKTALEVCEGQQLDINFEERDDVNQDEYIEMIRLKTSVLLGCALQLGAIIAGASEEDQKEIYSFGQQLGIAFQIQDDILDLYADPDKFGKQVGGDVIANKKTLLQIVAKSKANDDQLSQLESLSNEQDLVKKVEETRDLFDTLEVRKTCSHLMNQYNNEALSAIKNIQVDSSSKTNLLDLANYLLNREI